MFPEDDTTMIRQNVWISYVTVVVVAATMVLMPVVEAHAQGDREQARQHFLKGKELYDAGNFRGAIVEFETADRLAPAPMLDYNVGLSYEQLGEDDKAIQHFRVYLKRLPDAPNRATVEAKITRLEARLEALREVSSNGGAGGTSSAGAANGEAGGSANGEAGGSANGEVGGSADGEAGGSTGGQAGASTGGQAGASTGAQDGASAGGNSSVADGLDQGRGAAESYNSSAGGGTAAATGDPDLDAVAAVNVAAVRDQRSAYMGTPPSAPAWSAESASEPEPAGGSTDAATDYSDGEEERKPVYRQWWFWAVVGVSALIFIDVMRSDNSNAIDSAAAAPEVPVGAPIFRF